MQYGELISNLFFNLKALYQKNLKLSNASFQQLLVISLIEDDGVEMSVLSNKLGVDNSTSTRLIDGLEKKNWVKRKKSKLDNRIIRAYLTPKGQEISKIIEGQLDKIGFLIESEIDAGLRAEIIEAGISLNWAISKQLIKQLVNTNKNISQHVISWYNSNKRLLSFRDTKDPYKIWLSEIMLQQTKVSTVLPYYEKWIIKYPTIKSLYNANLDTLLKLWEGLGYYSRCNNFYKSIKIICDYHKRF